MLVTKFRSNFKYKKLIYLINTFNNDTELTVLFIDAVVYTLIFLHAQKFSHHFQTFCFNYS